MRSTRSLLGLTAALVLFGAACSDDDKSTTTTAAPETSAAADTTAAPETTAAPSFDGVLLGAFAIDAGDCSGAKPTGSYFQMIQPGGTPEAGPFIPNADSGCTADPNFTLLTPGTDGGLMTDSVQAAPDPAFDATGNGLAGAIFAPVKFFGVDFAVAMDATGTKPSITASNGTLTADLSAFTAYYGTGVFNQGAPKPDGSGAAPTGTIDPATGHYTLTWTSLIVGGSFDGFTGVWHLEGTFAPMG